MFFISFTKGNNMNSCFHLWMMQLLEWGTLIRKEFAPRRAHSFLEEVTVLRRENRRIASSEGIIIHIDCVY